MQYFSAFIFMCCFLLFFSASLGMDLHEAKKVIKSRCRTKRDIAEEIKVSENHLHRILSGGITDPHPLVKEAIINWAVRQKEVDIKELER